MILSVFLTLRGFQNSSVSQEVVVLIHLSDAAVFKVKQEKISIANVEVYKTVIEV